MRHIYLSLITLSIFSSLYSQNIELQGKWVLDKTTYKNGKELEINNALYSNKTIYTISPKNLKINNLYFDAQYTSNQIKTIFRTINFSIENKYLKVQEENDNKISYFLKADDFIKSYPEFKSQKVLREADTLLVANGLADYDFKKQIDLDEFIRGNMYDYPSKYFQNLYFQIEFILTKKDKIKDVKILNSISERFDRDYINSLRKAEKDLRNNTKYDLVIIKEINFLKWAKDISDLNEIKLMQFVINGNKFYLANKFEEAIIEYNKIKELNIKDNKFKITIQEALKKLAISYLIIGDISLACENFKLIGNNTDFTIRNYINRFCQ